MCKCPPDRADKIGNQMVESRAMKISLFTQSLFNLSLEEAIEVVRGIGFDGIEVACFGPHLKLQEARKKKDRIMKLINNSGLEISALSTYTNFTDSENIYDNVKLLNEFIFLARDYGTDLIKITPGPPASCEMESSDLENWEKAISECINVAKRRDVRLAVETHLGMISDTTESAKRLVENFDQTLGINLDFCNVYLGGDNPVESVEKLKDRLYFCHVKNVSKRKWVPLAEGELNYLEIISALRKAGYDGYLSIECLYDVPPKEKIEMIKTDYKSLKRILK